MKKILVITLFISANSFSQKDLGTWNITSLNIKMNNKWSAFFEAQLRSLSFYNQFHYYEFKGGISYKINPTFAVSSGIGSYNTYSEGDNFELPMQNKEIRTWFQVNMKNPLKFVTFEHRYRAEQRFTSNGFKNRFRYRIGATVPINNKSLGPKTFFLSGWNEIFFTNNEPFFERNRLFIGCGYEFSKQLTLQTGYIHQFDYKINDETGRDFLNLALLYSIDLNKKEKNNNAPTTID